MKQSQEVNSTQSPEPSHPSSRIIRDIFSEWLPSFSRSHQKSEWPLKVSGLSSGINGQSHTTLQTKEINPYLKTLFFSLKLIIQKTTNAIIPININKGKTKREKIKLLTSP